MLDKINKMLDDKKVKVMAGDIPSGEWEFNMGALWGAFETVQLQGEIKSVQLQTEEGAKDIARTLGWGLAGAITFGPVGALAGLVMGGNRKEVCALFELKDGRKFLALMDSKIYQQMLALSLSK